jgi:hypothetical protein
MSLAPADMDHPDDDDINNNIIIPDEDHHPASSSADPMTDRPDPLAVVSDEEDTGPVAEENAPMTATAASEQQNNMISSQSLAAGGYEEMVDEQDQSVGSSGMDMDYNEDDDEDEEEIIEEEIIDDTGSYEEEEVIMEDDDDSVTEELIDDEGIDEILEEAQEIMNGGDPSSRSHSSRSSQKSGGEGSQQQSKVGTVITGPQPAEQQRLMDGAQGQQDAPADEVPTSVVQKDVLLGDMSEMTHGSAKQPPVQHEEMLMEESSPREINGDGMNDKTIGEGSNRSSTSTPGNASSSSSIVESQKDRDPSERSVKEQVAIFSAASAPSGSPPGSPGTSLASSHAHSMKHSIGSNEASLPHPPRNPSGTADMLNASSIVATAAAADPKEGAPVDASMKQINQPEDESQQPQSDGEESEEDAMKEENSSENEEDDANPVAEVDEGAPKVTPVVAVVEEAATRAPEDSKKPLEPDEERTIEKIPVEAHERYPSETDINIVETSESAEERNQIIEGESRDIETGDIEKHKDNVAMDKVSSSKNVTDDSKDKRLVYIGALVCLVVVLVLIIGLSVGLTKNNDDNDREVPIPTPISPTDAPQPMVCKRLN